MNCSKPNKLMWKLHMHKIKKDNSFNSISFIIKSKILMNNSINYSYYNTDRKRSTWCEICNLNRGGRALNKTLWFLHLWLVLFTAITTISDSKTTCYPDDSIRWFFIKSKWFFHLVILNTSLNAFFSLLPIIPHWENDIWIGLSRKLLPLPDSESSYLAVHLFLTYMINCRLALL